MRGVDVIDQLPGTYVAKLEVISGNTAACGS